MVWTSRISPVLMLVAFGLPACGSNVGNAAPRIASIPTQHAAGKGATFSVDLATWVTDAAGSTLTYTVQSGGGAFSGSTYSNTFESMGEFTVSFQVSDGQKASLGTFTVVVHAANFAVVRVDGANLRLLDADTEKFLLVSQSPSVETFRAGLATGPLVFERLTGSNYDLFTYSPATRTTTVLGNATDKNERWVANATGGRVVFSVTPPGGTADLFVHDSAAGQVRTISAITGVDSGNVFVDGNGLVFFERTATGNSDVWYWNPATDTATAVSTDAADETLVGALAGGGVLFTRPGGTAETDLFYFTTGTGVLEVGIDVPALGSRSKTWHAATSDGRIVFAATDTTVAPATVNLYLWNPDGSSTTTVSATTTGEQNTFHAITTNDIVVYTATDTANGGNDIIAYTVSNGSRVTANAANTTHVFQAVTTVGSSSAVVYTIPGGSTSIHVYNIANATRYDANAASYTFAKVLPNGRVVFMQTTAGGGIFSYDHVANTFHAVSTGLGVPTFQADGVAAGDFVFSLEVSGQTDLFLWDESATAVVTVSSAAEDDTFQAVAPESGKVLFTRTGAGGNQDLFVFDPSDTSTEQLTTVDEIGNVHDFAVVGTYSADDD